MFIIFFFFMCLSEKHKETKKIKRNLREDSKEVFPDKNK